MKKFTALVYARTMEFLRDKGTFYWNLIFPIVLVVGFSIAFSGNNDAIFKIGIIGDNPGKPISFLELSSVELINYDSGRKVVIEKIRRHQIDMLIDFDENAYYLNNEASASELLRILGDGELKNFS